MAISLEIRTAGVPEPTFTNIVPLDFEQVRHPVGFESVRLLYQNFFLWAEKQIAVGTPFAVGAVVTRREGDKIEILLVRDIDRKNAWSNPAGHVDPGESIPEALARELEEEAGLSVSSHRYEVTDLVEVTRTINGTIYLLFAIQVYGNFEPKPTDTQEIGECGWFSLPEILRILINQNGKTFKNLLDYLSGEDINLTANMASIIKGI